MKTLLAISILGISLSAQAAIQVPVSCSFYIKHPQDSDKPVVITEKFKILVDSDLSPIVDPISVKMENLEAVIDYAGYLKIEILKDGKIISRGLWQSIKNLNSNHGITGLQYLLPDSDDEIQFFCKAIAKK